MTNLQEAPSTTTVTEFKRICPPITSSTSSFYQHFGQYAKTLVDPRTNYFVNTLVSPRIYKSYAQFLCKWLNICTMIAWSENHTRTTTLPFRHYFHMKRILQVHYTMVYPQSVVNKLLDGLSRPKNA